MEEKLFDSEFFARLGKMKMLNHMRLNGGMGGQRKSSAKGSSVEFSDFREYVPGDDIRRIDWNVYGRMDKLFVKEFMEEKEGMFHIMVDCSKSMDFGQKNKSILARRLAGMAAYLALNQLDRVRVTALHGSRASVGKGLTGRQAFPGIMADLEKMEFQGETSLLAAVKTISFRSRGTVILISDFLEGKEEEQERGEAIEGLIRYLRCQKQETVLFQVLSEEEQNPSGEGTLELLDSETEERMKVTMSARALKEYRNSLQELQRNLERYSRKYQARYISVSSGEALEAILWKGVQAGQWAGK